MLLMFIKDNLNAMMGLGCTIKVFVILFEWGLPEKVMCSYERGEIYGFDFHQNISQSLSQTIFQTKIKRLKNKMKWN